jgi:hypothetical protein
MIEVNPNTIEGWYDNRLQMFQIWQYNSNQLPTYLNKNRKQKQDKNKTTTKGAVWMTVMVIGMFRDLQQQSWWYWLLTTYYNFPADFIRSPTLTQGMTFLSQDQQYQETEPWSLLAQQNPEENKEIKKNQEQTETRHERENKGKRKENREDKN